MYESPIEIISREIRTQQEENVYKAVLEVGVNVDKDELIRALKYDRDQYNRGYHDGLIKASILNGNAKAKVAREIFEEIEEVLNNIGYFDELDFKALKKKYTKRVCTDCKHFVGCECFSGMTCDQYETEV